MKTALKLTMLVLGLVSSPAWAGSSDLLNRALESSSTEQSDLQRQIRARRLADPITAEERSSRETRTAVEFSIDAGDLGTVSARRPNAIVIE